MTRELPTLSLSLSFSLSLSNLLDRDPISKATKIKLSSNEIVSEVARSVERRYEIIHHDDGWNSKIMI